MVIQKKRLFSILSTLLILAGCHPQATVEKTYDEITKHTKCRFLNHKLRHEFGRMTFISLERNEASNFIKGTLSVMGSDGWPSYFRNNPKITFDAVFNGQSLGDFEWETKTIDQKNWVETAYTPIGYGVSMPIHIQRWSSTSEFEITAQEAEKIAKANKIKFKIYEPSETIEGDFDQGDFDIFKDFNNQCLVGGEIK